MPTNATRTDRIFRALLQPYTLKENTVSISGDICNDILWAIDRATNHTHNAREWDNPEYGDAFHEFIAPMLVSVTVRVRELEARVRELENMNSEAN